MNRYQLPHVWVVRWLVFTLVTMLALSAFGGETKKKADGKKKPPKPSITITKVPPATLQPGPDELGTIAGKVSGVNFKECKVVIFAYGDTWYVQPFTASPHTDIQKDGTWQNDTHGGYEYAALLVKNYTPPDTTSALPKVDGKKVLAIAKAKPKK